MREEIEVTIAPDGQVSIHVRGVKGQGCLALTKPLEEALGGQVQSRQATSEQYATGSVTEQQKTR